MSNNELLVLTFVLQESDKNTFNKLITITKNYLLSLDINFKTSFDIFLIGTPDNPPSSFL